MKNKSNTYRKSRVQTVFLYFVFICYLLFLTKLFFLSRISLPDLLAGPRVLERSVNLVPFRSIEGFLGSQSATVQRFAFANLAGNVIAFVPLGAFLALFRREKRLLPNMLAVFIASFFVELIQWIFAIGAAYVDDLILNCLGGLIGLLGYRLLRLLLRSERNVRIAATILCALALPYLLFLLFRVQLRL